MTAFRLRFRAPDPITSAPVNTELPTITGVAAQGQQATVSIGAWLYATSFAIQWKRDGVAIPDETSANYTFAPADVGALITAEVTATGPVAPPTAATSAAIGPIAGSSPDIPAAQTVVFGAKTRVGHGGHPLGYVGSGSLSILSGNTANHWQIDARNHLTPRSPSSVVYGAAPATMASSYTLVVTDGASTSVVTVNTVANTYHVREMYAAPVNADTSSSFQLKTVINLGSAVNFGDEIVLRDGVYNENQAATGIPYDWTIQRSGSGQFTQRVGGPVAPTSSSSAEGWVVVRAENALGATIRQLTVSGRNLAPQYLRFTDLRFERLNPTGTSSPKSLLIQSGSPTYLASWIKVDNCEICSEITDRVDEYSKRMGSGVGLVGALGTNPITMSNIFVHDNHIHDVYDAILTEGSKFEFIGNLVERVWNDCMKGRVTDFKINWNRFLDKKYAVGSDIHGDFIQQQWAYNKAGVVVIAPGSYLGGEIIGNIFMRGAGTTEGGVDYPDGQGIFISGADAGSGISITGMVIRGNFGNISKVHATYIEGCPNALVEWNTWTSAVHTDIGRRTMSQQYGSTSGLWRYNICEAYGLSGGTTTPNVQIQQPGGPATGELYADVFVDPVQDTSNDVDVMLARFAMKPGGPAEGAINFGAVGTGYVDYENRTTSFPVVP